MQFLTLDLEKTWIEYVTKWGKNFKFYQWDLNKDDFLKTIDLPKDLVIISNVLVMYMTNEKSYDFQLFAFKGNQIYFNKFKIRKNRSKSRIKKVLK